MDIRFGIRRKSELMSHKKTNYYKIKKLPV